MPRRKRNKNKSPQSVPKRETANGAESLKELTRRDSTESQNTTQTLSIDGLPSLSRVTSVIMLLVGILIAGLLFYKVMVGFFIPLFMAAALVVIFRPVNEWFLRRTGSRRRIAAVGTTAVILGIVLLPILLLLSIAIGEMPGLISRASALKDLQPTIENARDRIGLKLEYPNQFRRLDELTGSFDDIQRPEKVLAEIEEASDFVRGLEEKVASARPTEKKAEAALESLASLSETVEQMRTLSEPQDDSVVDVAAKIDVESDFHKYSVEAGSRIHSWMDAKLGGSFMTQAKFLTNPSERDLASSIRSVRQFIQPRFVKITNDAGGIVLRLTLGLLIMVISIYFFFIDGPSMVRTLMRLSPLDDEYELRLLGEFEKTSRAVVLASLLSAVVQGLLAAIGFWLCGLQSIILLFMVTTVMALIPFLGAASVWVPCAIYLGAVEGRTEVAVVLAIYGAVIVSSIDNVIKAFVLQGHSELHPLIALLSVLGGVPVFGPIGILIGPMVVVFLQTLLDILNHELRSPDDPQSPSEAIVESPPDEPQEQEPGADSNPGPESPTPSMA